LSCEPFVLGGDDDEYKVESSCSKMETVVDTRHATLMTTTLVPYCHQLPCVMCWRSAPVLV